jgi:hypothetical protein
VLGGVLERVAPAVRERQVQTSVDLARDLRAAGPDLQHRHVADVVTDANRSSQDSKRIVRTPSRSRHRGTALQEPRDLRERPAAPCHDDLCSADVPPRARQPPYRRGSNDVQARQA